MLLKRTGISHNLLQLLGREWRHSLFQLFGYLGHDDIITLLTMLWQICFSNEC